MKPRSFLLPLSLALAASPAFAVVLELNPTQDTFIRGGAALSPPNNLNYGAGGEILVGTIVTGDSARGLFSFDLTSPDLVGATINSVTLTLTTTTTDGSSTSASITYNLHQLTQSYNAGLGSSSGGDVGATWNSFNRTSVNQSANPWTTAGGTFNSGVLSSITANPATIPGSSEVVFNSSVSFTSLIASSLGGSVDLLLKQATDGTAPRELLRFNSVNSATVGFRPVLTIDYTPIPEPSSAAALLGLGALGLVAARRRRA